MERREFFQSLIAGGAAVGQRPERRNRRAHHKNARIYHGPMMIPERIAAIVAEHPSVKRTTDRHLVSRYAEGGWVWLFRCQIPESRAMVGEIVLAEAGQIRVHCWSAARLDGRAIAEPAEIVGRQASDGSRPALLPPLAPPVSPGWRDE